MAEMNSMENNLTEQNDVIIYRSKDGKINVALMTRDGNVWLNQQQMAELFGTSVPNITMHIGNILKEGELNADSVIKKYLTAASDGKSYEVAFYSLQMIIAVGCSPLGTDGKRGEENQRRKRGLSSSGRCFLPLQGGGMTIF